MEASYTKPLPVIEPLTAPYWEHAKAHRLVVQKCERCGDRHFPPSPVCPECLSEDQSWEVVSGRGKLLSWATFHRAYWDSFRDDVPYDVCVVQLDEGPTVVSNFAEKTRETLRIGLPLRVVFEDVTSEISLARFVVDIVKP